MRELSLLLILKVGIPFGIMLDVDRIVQVEAAPSKCNPRTSTILALLLVVKTIGKL